MQELSLFLILRSVLPDRTFHIKNVAATSNFQTLCERWLLNFGLKKMVILDSGGNYLRVKKVAGSFTEIGAP